MLTLISVCSSLSPHRRRKMIDASDRGADAEGAPIIGDDPTDSLPYSHPRPSHSTTPDSPLWYRSDIIRTACLVSFALLVVLNIFSLALDSSEGGCALLFVFQIISTVVYGLLFILLAIAAPSLGEAGASSAVPVRLLFAVVSAVCHIVLLGMTVLSLVSLLVSNRCEQRVYFMFVTTLDTATPLFACLFLCSHAVLQYVGQYRQKQDEGVSLSPLTPSASDPHFLYYALSALLCLINVAAAIHHAWLARVSSHSNACLLSWVFIIVQSFLTGVLAIALFAGLLYRVSLSPSNQQKHVLATVSGSSQEALVLVGALSLAWQLSLWVNGLLTVVLFVDNVHIGGMAVVGWLNNIGNVAMLLVLVWEVKKNWAGVTQCGEAAWLTLKGEGMATGIYAREGRASVEISTEQSRHDGDDVI